MTTCEKCGRLILRPGEVLPEAERSRGWCLGPTTLSCQVTAAYARGRAEGMREAIDVAKECIVIYVDRFGRFMRENWSDVDAEIKRRLGDA